MINQLGRQFQTVIRKFVYAYSTLVCLLGFPAISLSLWFSWAHRSTLAESVVETVFCLSMAWAFVSMLQLRKVKLSSSERTRVFSGPRPTDPDELYAWKWGWQFMYAVISGMLSMIAIPVTVWLIGK